MKSPYSESYARLLTRLKRARKAANITQQELAKTLKRPQSYVSKGENGERRIDVIEFIEWIEALGADRDQMLNEVVERVGPPAIKSHKRGRPRMR